MKYYSGIKKEQTTNTINKVDESQKHNAKEKKPGAKDNILYDYIYMKCSEKANLQWQKVS